MRKIKDWLIRALGGIPSESVIESVIGHPLFTSRHYAIEPIKLKVTDTMDDGHSRCMPDTTAHMYMARKLAERIIDDELYEIKYERGSYGTVKRTMTVEILPPLGGDAKR